MDYNNEDRRTESVYSQKVRAGKKRTYFFDIRTTRNNDYYLTITESKRRFNGDGYERHKIFVYKEDFNKFLNALTETVNHVKTELMPDFDFDAFNHEFNEEEYENQNSNTTEVVTEKKEEVTVKLDDEEELINIPAEQPSAPKESSSADTTIHTDDAEKW